jgi:hypothetical protein
MMMSHGTVASKGSAMGGGVATIVFLNRDMYKVAAGWNKICQIRNSR